jgi:hypothetical protein
MSDTFRKAYRTLEAEEAAAVESLKVHAEAIEALIKKFPARREAALAMTNLEQAVMWGVKHITG